MSLLAIIGYTVGPITMWLGSIDNAIISTFGQLIGGILAIPVIWLYDLVWPFGL